jgi:hypothetical protein
MGSRIGPVFRQAALGGGLLCFATGICGAQTLTVSGDPALMAVTTAAAGFAPNSVTNAVTTYTAAARRRQEPQKITGRLNQAMPVGMTLTVNLAPTTGATSNGAVTLDATTRDLVGNITNTNNLTRSITYVLAATPAAGVVPPQSRTVTFTITAWP